MIKDDYDGPLRRPDEFEDWDKNFNAYEDYLNYVEEQYRNALENEKCEVHNRAYFLRKASEIVCNDREKQYGSPEDNFRFIAELWSAYLFNDNVGKLEPKDVAVMMTLFKIGRMLSGKPKEDNWIDAIGYLACGAELEAKMEDNDDRK